MADEKYETGEDGYLREIVGDWALEKHDRIRKYVDISRHARRKFLTGQAASAGYIDLFCGTGQCRIRGKQTVVDGSPLVAFRAARTGGHGFTEIHIGDILAGAVAATQYRLESAGGVAAAQVGPAEETARNVIRVINPYGLHFAVLDPYRLENLTFELIRTLSQLKHVDMLLHVSAMDLQRNLEAYSDADKTQLDGFAPGWRSVVDLKQSKSAVRAAVLKHWATLVQELGFSEPRYDLVTGDGNQRLYWLAFISRNEIANDFWQKIRYIHGQGDLFANG